MPLAELHRSALDAWSRGEQEHAAALLRRAVREALPADALNDLAVMEAETGNPGSARALLESALALDPGNDEAETNLGRLPSHARAGSGRARISLLLPTRRRPAQLQQMVGSAYWLADRPEAVEVVVYVDDDDENYTGHYPGVRFVRGPRIVLSECWNRCYEASTGDILMHSGDDIVFRTPGWDSLVEAAFADFPDRIAFVHGDDCSGFHGAGFGTHGFLHRAWAETVGYFVPPHFSSDYNDTWLNDVANRIDRRVFVSALLTDHLHPAWGKGVDDETHRERRERHERDRVEELYESLEPLRAEDARKLARAIEAAAQPAALSSSQGGTSR